MAVGLSAARLTRLRAVPWRWVGLALALVAVLAVPIVVIGAGVLRPAGPSWDHVAGTLLPAYVGNTVILVLGVGVLALVLGVGAAWLVTMTRFPGHRFFSWALVLPLAVPAYMAAYTWAGMLDVTGPVQRLVRTVVPGMSDAFLQWNVMRIEAVVVIFAVVLYPYVFLLSRTLLERRSGSVLESARLLGRSGWSVFFRVGVPLVRPAMAGGVALVLMEVLNDYGAVKYYGVPTFTTGIFRAWFTLGDVDTAIRLSGILMLIVLVLLVLERWQRGDARYSDAGASRFTARYPLRGWRAAGAVAFCATPLVLGFALPVAQLLAWSGRSAGTVVDAGFLVLSLNSFGLAAAAGGLAVAVAVVLAYAARIERGRLTAAATKLALLGYSVPGAVIAVGVLVAVLALDRTVLPGAATLLTATVLALLFAYLVRFMAVAFLSVESGFERVGESVRMASRTAGASPLRTLARVELPLLKGALGAAGILVFVDVLKELPLTLILRPFNFDTLATRAFQLATDEQLAASAPSALMVILTATAVLVVLHRVLANGETG
ncbi:MAG: iron ABC transporter permease [Longimicrobiales bacterium]|nr:iron ABC transporter permease [Longimicrobiales bacterium]